MSRVQTPGGGTGTRVEFKKQEKETESWSKDQKQGIETKSRE